MLAGLVKGDSAATAHARRLGRRVVAKELRDSVFSRSLDVGLRCDLSRLPSPKEAAIRLRMEPCTTEFNGFEAELERTTGDDYGLVLRRKRLHDLGVRTLHVAWDVAGEPVYVQWLITAKDHESLDAVAVDYWPRLSSEETLLEFAYTFIAFRGMGVMTDAMGRLLRIAATQGASVAYTYVGVDNIASLRGCARVGFTLDHMREASTKMALRRSSIRAPSPAEREAWDRATAPRA